MTPGDQQLVDAIRGLERALARTRAASTTIEDLSTLGLATDRHRALLQSLRKVELDLSDMLVNCRQRLHRGQAVSA